MTTFAWYFEDHGDVKTGDVRYNEAATFSDANPLTKNDTVVGIGSLSINSDESGDELKKNPFLDPDVAEHWAIIYEKSQYECRSAFDPTFTWTEEEERKIVRRLDWRVCLWACVMFFGLQVDRGNLVQAVSDNLLNDLNLTTNDYNFGNVIFLFSFLLAELPSQLVSKKIGPDRWIPMQITLWSTVAMSQCALSGKKSFYATRSILGLLEGGFIQCAK
ncbi:uncharacterized protein RAG0_06618 [Rhynchosporium agropyri]|uniref:Allantoate permease n=1 Tax=Rhynchosporium agropyri TaxID=914238 RepID=A0A1E1KHX9_9HELO|nr:uncharacterized protein RAG0_06618 [Rhynchosporium agropyri]